MPFKAILFFYMNRDFEIWLYWNMYLRC